VRILLTNDDGIMAPGICALLHAIEDLGEVTVVAPYTVQSATSHGVTFHKPLMVHEVTMDGGRRGIAIDGRPADCVKIALTSIWEQLHGEGSRPDLTISGMNSGANVGINVIYSGTVAAAVESAFLGVPSIAVSLQRGNQPEVCWSRAAGIARVAIDRVLAHTLDPHAVINLNVPFVDSEDAPMPPMKVVTMNTAAGLSCYEERNSPEGQRYFWATGDGMRFHHTMPDSDVEAIDQSYLSITPLAFDLTDHARLQTWRERIEG